jgi:hypothetical protein
MYIKIWSLTLHLCAGDSSEITASHCFRNYKPTTQDSTKSNITYDQVLIFFFLNMEKVMLHKILSKKLLDKEDEINLLAEK